MTVNGGYVRDRLDSGASDSSVRISEGPVKPVRGRVYSASEVIKGVTSCNTPQETDQVIALRTMTNNADWGQFFAEKKTRTLCSAAWSASEERCEQLRGLCMSTAAKRVLEIGSFVGVSTLSMAQVLPDNGEIVSLEIDPFAVDFGLDIKVESDAFWRSSHMVGPAWDSLQSLVQQMEDAGGQWEPFDLAVIDADKAGMMEYFEMLTEIQGLMSDDYVIVVDVKRFKGQLSTQEPDKNDAWIVNTGQREIDDLRKYIDVSSKFECRENGSLLQVCKKQSFTMANSPFAAFPNSYTCVFGGDANWSAPQAGMDPVSELRKAVNNTDWAEVFAEGSTQIHAAASWSSSEERCEVLKALCKASGASNVLELGSFCGVASLAMAEAIPESGRIVSLEIDPFLVGFGEDIKANSECFSKVSHMIGPAMGSLKTLANQVEGADAKGKSFQAFDFVVIDADKIGMLEYFKLLWDTPGMLTPYVTVCVDITPFKCQLFVPYVKGKMDDWIVKSGRDSIDSFTAFVKSLDGIKVTESNGLFVIRTVDQGRI